HRLAVFTTRTTEPRCSASGWGRPEIVVAVKSARVVLSPLWPGPARHPEEPAVGPWTGPERALRQVLGRFLRRGLRRPARRPLLRRPARRPLLHTAGSSTFSRRRFSSRPPARTMGA